MVRTCSDSVHCCGSGPGALDRMGRPTLIYAQYPTFGSYSCSRDRGGDSCRCEKLDSDWIIQFPTIRDREDCDYPVSSKILIQRKDPLNSVQDLLLPALLVGLPLALVMLQPDLGTAMAFGGILFAMFFWAGTPVILLLLIASPVLGLILSYDTIIWSGYMVALVGFLYLFRYRLLLFESVGVVLANLAAGTVAQPLWNRLAIYQQNRILVFLNPEVDPRGAGYQLIQSKVAVGSGGVMGQGFTLGSQKRYDFLPEQHTDFIFSVVGEELGFIGTVLGILAFCFILGRLVHLATRTPDPFAGLVVLGIFGAWLAHIFVNIGMTVGVVPITGIPLPFVSYGGTFLLMCRISLAIAVRVAHEG